MNRSIRAAAALSLLLVLGLGGATVNAQTAIQMEVLREQLQSDKKLIIAANLELTEEEAEAFWPIYDEYQIEIESINNRIGWLIRDFGELYSASTVSEDAAEELLNEAIELDEDEVAVRKKFVRQIRKVISPSQAIRYVQIENKIRAAIRFDLAANIPLMY